MPGQAAEAVVARTIAVVIGLVFSAVPLSATPRASSAAQAYPSQSGIDRKALLNPDSPEWDADFPLLDRIYRAVIE